MARRSTLTHDALIALGPEKLAQLVLDETGRNAAFKRIVMAALAATHGPEAIAAVIDRRLAALERARGIIAWEKQRAFVGDLKATLTTITDELGAADPAAAVERILRFLTGAEGVFERVDDSSGHIQAVYWAAAEALPSLAARLDDPAKAQLPEPLLPLLAADSYGLMERVAHALVPLLPLDARDQFDAALATAIREIGPVRDGARDWTRQARRDRLIRARQAIADQRGDVDAFVVLEQGRGSACPDSLGVAVRLLAASRAAEALDWVRRPARLGLRVMSWKDLGDGSSGSDVSDRNRIQLEVRILEALGDHEAAQALRWQTFETTLDAPLLRDYLAHLPDFAEFEALDRAFAHATNHPHRYAALAFLLAWPRLDLAARLVLEHREAWDGRHYGALVPAAEALESGYPAAAAVLYRALIDDILTRPFTRLWSCGTLPCAARCPEGPNGVHARSARSRDVPGQAAGGARTQDGVLEPCEPLVGELSASVRNSHGLERRSGSNLSRPRPPKLTSREHSVQ